MKQKATASTLFVLLLALLTIYAMAMTLAQLRQTVPNETAGVKSEAEILIPYVHASHDARLLQTRDDPERVVERTSGEEREAGYGDLDEDNEVHQKALTQVYIFFAAIWVVPVLACCCKLKRMQADDDAQCSGTWCCCTRTKKGKCRYRRADQTESAKFYSEKGKRRYPGMKRVSGSNLSLISFPLSATHKRRQFPRLPDRKSPAGRPQE